MTAAALDFDRLLKLRLVVARYGEMDLAKWWNTRGQLGRLGTAATRRGFPRTHYFAQARSVFAVAASRCREVFDPPRSVTLWQLSETLEGGDLKTILQSLGLITNDEAESFPRLRRSAEGRAVPLPVPFSGTDQDVASLALGFARGEPGSIAVPYALREAA
jgi:hypothetical protein